MQPGVSSSLFDSLKVYLNNKNRLQPIIGLGCIIECVKTGSNLREALYLCEVCVCRLSKADMRNHIVGSLHRHNYIKVWHPHFASQLKENSDLSLLARPLMEMAKMLEEKEGPGHVKLLAVEDAVYQKMERCSDSDAVTHLINSFRRGQGQDDPQSCPDSTSAQLEHYDVHSHRSMKLSQDHQRQSQINKPPSLMWSNIASPLSSAGWLDNVSSSQLDNSRASRSSSSSSFLDGYTGTKPLMGLYSVAECKGEDGHTHCFLCHCCRIRTNRKDVVDHLTSTSHLINYLMLSHPEQVGDINNTQLLQSLAEKVQQEEGQGELEVVNAPESLCIQMTGRSYHWCALYKNYTPQGLKYETLTSSWERINMLYYGGTSDSIQKRRIPVKEPVVNRSLHQDVPEKHAAGTWKQAKWQTPVRKMKGKKKKGPTTVFRVSLPISRGSILLERTTFSTGSSEFSSSADSDLSPSTETEEWESDCDSESFSINNSECQEDFTDSGQYASTWDNGADGYFTTNDYFNQDEGTASEHHGIQQSYVTQPLVNPATYVCNPGNRVGSMTNPDQLLPYPVYAGGDAGMYHSNPFTQPGQAQWCQVNVSYQGM